MPRRQRAATTTAAGALALLVTLPFAVSIAQNLASFRGDTRRGAVESGAVMLGVPLQSYGGLVVFTTAVLAVASLVALAVGLAILARRRWGREVGMPVFGLFALSLPVALVGLLADPPAPAAGVGVAVGVTDVVIVVLLAQQRTADDFELAERERRDRRQRRRSPEPVS